MTNRGELAKVIGRCERCGQEFVTMPRDGMDHFGRRQYGTNISKVCGGAVIPLSDGEQARPAKEGK